MAFNYYRIFKSKHFLKSAFPQHLDLQGYIGVSGSLIPDSPSIQQYTVLYVVSVVPIVNASRWLRQLFFQRKQNKTVTGLSDLAVEALVKDYFLN